MQCPFCGKEAEPGEVISGNWVEYRCSHCQNLTAAYLKGMEPILKNLVSLERFQRRSE